MQYTPHSLLTKKQQGFSEPFPLPYLLMLSQETGLHCEKILRFIPKKRMVIYGHWQGKAVVAKLFFGASAKKHLLREVKGSEQLLRAGILTPAVLFYGQASESNISVLIFEYIPHAETLGTFWQKQQNSPSSEMTLHALTVELATQHVMGLMQKDLHLNNFLYAQGKIYTLDTSHIEQSSGPLTKKASLKNLALFFSQLGIHTNKLQQRLLHSYLKARCWQLNKKEVALLQTTIHHYNVKRWHAFRKKIFRNSTQFAQRKIFGRKIIYDRNYDSALFQQLLENPDAFFNHPQTVILKAGHSATVIRITLNNQHLVVKRYNMKSLWHRLKRCLQPTRAAVSWRLAHQLQFTGMPTAKPVAFIEKRLFNLRGTSYFVMEYIEGIGADAFFKTNPADSLSSLSVAKKLIALFFNLTRLKLSHGDLKITNILLNEHQEPVLIDLDSMRQHRFSQSLWQRFRKDIQRFLKNWQDNPAMRQLFEKLLAEMSI